MDYFAFLQREGRTICGQACDLRFFWGMATATNVAASANGGTASASSTLPGYYASATNNGDRKGTNWISGGGWVDNTSGTFPDWLQIDFNGSQTISEIDVFTVQDNYTSPADPTEAMTFNTYGLTGYDVQYWNGSAWLTVTGGSIVGNAKVWRKISFAPVNSTKIRVLTNAAAGARTATWRRWRPGPVPAVCQRSCIGW